MTDQQLADLGIHARNVLDNPAFAEAISRMHKRCYDAFKAIEIRDAEGLKLARQYAALAEDFESDFRRMIEAGKAAKLNLDRHRDESRAKRVLHKFTR